MPHGTRGQSGKLSAALAALALLWPTVAFASFGGSLDLSFEECMLIGIIAALPGAIAVLVLEWRGATWTPPSWAGALAALAFGYCVLHVTGVAGPGGDRGRSLLTIPPLIQFVLITFVASSRARHAAGWAVAAASVLFLVLVQMTPNALGPPGRPEGWGFICGGVLATALLWQLGVWLGRRSLRRRNP